MTLARNKNIVEACNCSTNSSITVVSRLQLHHLLRISIYYEIREESWCSRPQISDADHFDSEISRSTLETTHWLGIRDMKMSRAWKLGMTEDSESKEFNQGCLAVKG